MMITIIEAHVAKENWSLLEQAYQRNTQQTPPGLSNPFWSRVLRIRVYMTH